MDPRELYAKGTRVWLPDPDQVWIGAELLEDIQNDEMELVLEDEREVVLSLDALGGQWPHLRNPDILVGANDLTTLSYLHEPAVLYNLRERFLSNQAIYTYCGIVLVALNPYYQLPLYGPDMIAAYNGQSVQEMDPHIFAIAEASFKEMVNMGKNQSIIVSGESGAGKTVSAKYAMRYFANVGGSLTETMIEKKVLASNPIMEAIGNATTIRNDNSSRFGKYIELNFDDKNSIIGANMRTYLLEKSRVVFQAANERNYHIFYQMCACRDLPELQELNLASPDDFFYTSQGKHPVVAGIDDGANFLEVCEAMSMLGIYSDMQRMIWRILASVLHLGDVTISKSGKNGDGCHVKADDFHLMMVASLLGIDQSQLCKWLCARKIIATGDVYVKPLTFHEASVGRNALAKHIYAQLFKWVVEHINASLVTVSQRKSFIGVLDIYGFETFEVNSFEQFCINYANEKLQQQFNQHVFKLEQEEYIKEGIKWSFIDYYDNQPCIDLIETKMGILDLLDEECRMPKGSDAQWAQKLYKQHIPKSKHFVKPRMSDKAFIIRHYADDVIYDCNQFVEKNRDSINEEHLSLLKASQYELVGELFQMSDPAGMFAPRKRASSRVGRNAPKGKKTVGSEFRDSLQRLMDTLNSTVPHYVRCIKSNDAKEAFSIDDQRCVQQLRACGVLETIRISASGYPSRWSYEEFFERYRMLISWKSINWDSLKDTCNLILSQFITDEDKFQLGKRKIFFRAGQVAYLEKLRSDKLRASCIMIQKNVRGWLYGRKYRQMRKAVIMIQKWVRGHQARCLARFMRQTVAAITIQAYWRGYHAWAVYQQTRSRIIIVQSLVRGWSARRRVQEMIYQRKALLIQRVWRGYRERKKYKKTLKSIVYLQCCIRRMYARRELKKLKIEARSVAGMKKATKGLEKKIMSMQEQLTAEMKEKKAIRQKLEELSTHEAELQSLREIRPLYEELVKKLAAVEKENEEFKANLEATRTEKEQLAQEMEKNKTEREQELQSSRDSFEALKKEKEEEIETFKKESEKLIEQLNEKVAQEKQVLESEISVERTSHQKMVGEYARLEQRYQNLMEEKMMEKNTPDRVRPSVASFDDDSLMVIGTPETKVNALTSEIFEITRERDLLLEQIELLKEEQNISSNIPKLSDADASSELERLKKENKRLEMANQRIADELQVVSQVIKEDEEDNMEEKHEQVMSKLLKQIKELREENGMLRKKLDELEARDIIKGEYTKDQPSIPNGTMNDNLEKEWSRLTMENLKLREDVANLEEQLKEAQDKTFMSPPRTRSIGKRFDKNISPENQNQNEMESRRRCRTMDPKAIERRRNSSGVHSEAGKLVMTYAGLYRKRNNSSETENTNPTIVTTPSSKPLKSKTRQGMLKFQQTAEQIIMENLVLNLNTYVVEKEVPGLPAHLLFMGLRYIDHINDERMMQSYLSAAFSSIKKRVKSSPGDLDLAAFWMANTFRLLNDMKQYSGEEIYQSQNTPVQISHCLKNFDLSEYRQVLSDLCINIYQDMVSLVQKRLDSLVVPGMLEYESIPGVMSTIRKFKSERKEVEEIITVKDITNKLSAILAVLNAHCVDPSLIKQIFRQLYWYLNGTMINMILIRKDMCHWSRGLQVKFNLTQLEEWVRTNQLHENSGIIEELEPITEVVQLLQISKRSLEDVDGILKASTRLNALQVQKILSMYTPQNEYEPRIPATLIRAVKSRFPKATTPIYIMVDLTLVQPIAIQFSPAAVHFEKITIPNKLTSDQYTII